MEGGILLSNIFNKNGHLSQWTLTALKAGILSEVELLRSTSHIADCESCAIAYADSFSLDELVEVPFGFADEITRKLYYDKNKNREFIFYSTKVIAAVCLSLIIVFSGALNYATTANSIAEYTKPPDLSFVNSINVCLQNFSEKILNMEVLQYDKEKK